LRLSLDRMVELKDMRILFICTGNMCRSPAAEKLLAHYGAAKGFQARSRGTAAQPYCKMPRQVTAFLEARGVAHLAHKPALATETDINWADVILVMEEMHRDTLAEKFPQSMRKSKLFLEYCGGEGDLRDPMGKGDEVFEEVLKQIEEAIKKMVEKK